jgi:hypothetical protein
MFSMSNLKPTGKSAAGNWKSQKPTTAYIID